MNPKISTVQDLVRVPWIDPWTDPSPGLASSADMTAVSPPKSPSEASSDKARLDWIESNADQIHCSKSGAGNIEQYWIAPTRAAIDAAMGPDKTQCTGS